MADVFCCRFFKEGFLYVLPFQLALYACLFITVKKFWCFKAKFIYCLAFALRFLRRRVFKTFNLIGPMSRQIYALPMETKLLTINSLSSSKYDFVVISESNTLVKIITTLIQNHSTNPERPCTNLTIMNIRNHKMYTAKIIHINIHLTCNLKLHTPHNHTNGNDVKN